MWATWQIGLNISLTI